MKDAYFYLHIHDGLYIFDTAHYVCILNRCLYGLPDCQCYLNRATQPKLITSYTREFFFHFKISTSLYIHILLLSTKCSLSGCNMHPHMHIWSYGHPKSCSLNMLCYQICLIYCTKQYAKVWNYDYLCGVYFLFISIFYNYYYYFGTIIYGP